MKKTHSLTLAALLLLCGCVADDLPVIPQPQETHELMTHVSMDQAARRLGKLCDSLNYGKMIQYGVKMTQEK